ncbi:hypothetical protein HYV31_02230 [candidate division WWE3 bacterium]|nr:hypothetical protein [candidate division WWE3 bacterium]
MSKQKFIDVVFGFSLALILFMLLFWSLPYFGYTITLTQTAPVKPIVVDLGAEMPTAADAQTLPAATTTATVTPSSTATVFPSTACNVWKLKAGGATLYSEPDGDTATQISVSSSPDAATVCIQAIKGNWVKVTVWAVNIGNKNEPHRAYDGWIYITRLEGFDDEAGKIKPEERLVLGIPTYFSGALPTMIPPPEVTMTPSPSP